MRWIFFIALLLSLCTFPTQAQEKDQKPDLESRFLNGMRYRPIGPFRGGRSAAVCGIPGNPNVFYFGAAGGGVWKTSNAGETWKNISDGFFGGSIGAVEVNASDPNVIYVGGGEVTVRGNVSSGNGVWRSTDAGKTWRHMGLADTKHIPRIRTHPDNPAIVYVAALGHLYGPNAERGVYRSLDGGNTWKKILFVNDEVGAVDLIIDPNNTRILYAATWRVKRTPYSLESGGEGSGLWKSTDSGDTWVNITRSPGLPGGKIGICGVTVSPVDSDRVYAIIEADDGGVFRSDDGGAKWRRINEDRNLRQRAWYYSRIYAGPDDVDEVYVLNVQFWRSKDGGKNFNSISTPHVDHHDLWIDPKSADRMIIADDGGAQISVNRGKKWSTYGNQPTAQFYRVTTDNHFPYRIYGAQQDNSTVRINHRSAGSSIDEEDWQPTAGGESGHIAIDPTNSDIVYGGSYGGYLTRVDHKRQQARNINIWPDNPIGHAAKDLKYRFQWNFPIFFSPHNPKKLYAAANVLFSTTNEGQSWQQISPDLTTDDKSKQESSGGPITKDNTSVEYYCTIFAACESPVKEGVLWTGSDDGLIHVSKDGGKTWKNVTPKGMPKWVQVNSVEPHPSNPGGLYFAGTRYKSDDFAPYLYKTTDYGKTWEKIDSGIGKEDFTRVIRADKKRPGLLFAGTEHGMYVSLDDGKFWKPFQLNLPQVPITDLAIHDNDLIVATQGRSFWVLDDFTPLRQFQKKDLQKTFHVFPPRNTYRMDGNGSDRPPLTAGQNLPGGVMLFFHATEKAKNDDIPLTLEIREKNGKVIHKYSTKPKKGAAQLPVQFGLNRFVWNLRYEGAKGFPGIVLWAGGLQGPIAKPGEYVAVMTFGKMSQTVPFRILPDPRATASPEDYQAQFDFLMEVRDKLTETHTAIKNLRDIRGQLQQLSDRLRERDGYEDVIKTAKAINAKMTKVEEALYQTKNQSAQDPLNFPIRLNNKLSALVSTVSQGDYPPTKQAVLVKDMVTKEIDVQLEELNEVFQQDLPRFNSLLREQNVPGVLMPLPSDTKK